MAVSDELHSAISDIEGYGDDSPRLQKVLLLMKAEQLLRDVTTDCNDITRRLNEAIIRLDTSDIEALLQRAS